MCNHSNYESALVAHQSLGVKSIGGKIIGLYCKMGESLSSSVEREARWLLKTPGGRFTAVDAECIRLIGIQMNSSCSGIIHSATTHMNESNVLLLSSMVTQSLKTCEGLIARFE